MWDDFEDEKWDGEDWRHQRPEGSKSPLTSKANDIVRLTFALVGSLDEAHTRLYGEAMIRDAKKIRIEMLQASTESNYVFKMEHAVLVKVHARSLCETSSQLTGQGSLAKEHEKLLRDAILEMKQMFARWVGEFSKNGRIDDGWGLFMD